MNLISTLGYLCGVAQVGLAWPDRWCSGGPHETAAWRWAIRATVMAVAFYTPFYLLGLLELATDRPAVQVPLAAEAYWSDQPVKSTGASPRWKSSTQSCV